MRGPVVRWALALLGMYALALGVGAIWARAASTPLHCPSSGAVVLVDSTARVLCLCHDGHEDGRFRVALGRGGLDKRREFDGKTPLGRYSLGPAIPSSRFHLFLPVGYPTEEQRARGYSGSAIGLHGPHLGFAWLGSWTAWPNWTQGCIAVGTHREIERIEKWRREQSHVAIVVP